ncbi:MULTISPECIES: hypothetical protein [unclassified Pseudomonas]|uniref:hypothetical protein n=1 Tax=unclassified Pseudomonas TaxID=196821 RepID=UPI0011AF01B0|nr:MULTISPECIES: hypothetical protein [unclassified Pseudomonas]
MNGFDEHFDDFSGGVVFQKGRAKRPQASAHLITNTQLANHYINYRKTLRRCHREARQPVVISANSPLNTHLASLVGNVGLASKCVLTGEKKPGGSPVSSTTTSESIMHLEVDASNIALQAILHQKAYHQSAALNAARMIRLQYAVTSKAARRRECVEHLRASLCGGGA